MRLVIHFVVLLLLGAFSIILASANSENYNCLPTESDVPGSHSLFLGCLLKNDTLLYSEIINKPARPYRTREKLITYPDVNSLFQNRIISAIRCYDLIGKGRGGYARILIGGIKERFVELKLSTMEINRALKFKVEIYGRL